MSPDHVLALAAWLVFLVGLMLTWRGWRGQSRPVGRLRRNPVVFARLGLLMGGGLLVWLVTGWPAMGLVTVAAGFGLPAILGADRREQRRIARVEGVEEWARRVADVVAIGVGLEQALQSAARSAPQPIESEVHTLAARIAARTPTEQALRQFADEVADPAADLVVASLILAARRRGPGVATALTAIAGSVGEEVAARRRVEADRAKPRATARAVTAITVLIMAIGLLNSGYTQPYGTALGQLVLGATMAGFAAALWWMHSMTSTSAPQRLLAPAKDAVP
jgi:Flp pilus assembly protein TadB